MWDMTFAYNSMTGTRVLARQLTTALRKLDVYEIVEVTARAGGDAQKTNRANGIGNVWWLGRELSRVLETEHAALLHVAAYVGPRRAPCPSIANIFDTTYLTYPNDFDWKWRAYAQVFIPNTIRRASAVLTLSEHAKSEIARHYKLLPEQVNVVYPGVSGVFCRTADAETINAAREKFDLPENYLIFVGAQMPRKNIPALIQALGKLGDDLGNLTLVLVGPRERGSSEIQRVISELGLRARVRELGFIGDVDLAVLYQGARAFVYASKLEGFGMPPVEAMACGTPVVCAPNPPMPEVLGDAAYFTQNDSPEALAEGIARVLKDEALAQTLRARGIARAQMYTWENAARKTLAVYQQVLETRRAK